MTAKIFSFEKSNSYFMSRSCIIIMTTSALFLLLLFTPQHADAKRDKRGIDQTINDHWERPFTIKAPVVLKPRECSICHVKEYEAWKDSRHSKAMSSGIIGQLDPHKDPDFAYACYYCHGPLDVQQEMIYNGVEFVKNKSFLPSIKKTGVSCLVCHGRDDIIYGPLKGENYKEKPEIHFKLEEKEFFSDSYFCASCHQFAEDENRVNGKLVEDTYNQWLKTDFSKQGVTCQSCHMSEREHAFKGIHDLETVLNGIEINYEIINKKVILKIKNTGVGHKFPTYLTPLIEISAYQKNTVNEEVKGSRKEDFIGWVVALDLETEHRDTRLDPGEEFKFTYDITKDGFQNLKLVQLEIKVYPDMFYERFFKEMLKEKTYKNKELIEKALKETRESPYVLWSKEVYIGRRPYPNPLMP